MTPILLATSATIAAYLIGSLSGSLLLGKLRGVDIRTMGSGNAGGTNAFRTQGFKFALGVVVVDIGKGALSAWIGLHASGRVPASALSSWLPYAIAIAAVIGHVWPVWHGFRGGKGAATAIGATLVLWPAAVPVLLAVWLSCLILSGYVGLSTVLAGASLTPFAAIAQAPAPRLAFALAVAALLLFTHRGNLARLRAGTESRFENARLLHRLRQRA
ncbi:MAG: glycerol-3-phosphate 1-O-acyltransferase PlsY [Lysobacteraceae bacterium]|nr:MAG: glycerol-3-phosphate 1-O-acyltransferase PlsY [Xanthomonadaceae bacterium]